MKKRLANLTFFSETGPERLKCEIQQVAQRVQNEELTFQAGHEQLHNAQEDAQQIYYHLTALIGSAKSEITDLRKNGRYNRAHAQQDNFLSLQTRRAMTSLNSGIEAFKTGIITKRQLKRQAKMCKDLINQDVISLVQEMKDQVNQLKTSDINKLDETDRRRQNEEDTQDMTVKKTDPHDDFAG